MSKRLGLALGGGGARGLAHLGVLIALQDEGIPVSMIAGTSMGAVMGAAMAVGGDLKLIAKVLVSVDLNDMLQVSDSTVREVQKIVGRSMVEYVRGSVWREEDSRPHDLLRLRELFGLLTAGKCFRDIKIPYAAVAANLETGERVVLREGLLSDAVVASTSVPGVFSPVAFEGQFLIDGGVVDKLPADVVIDMGAEAVLAVDTGAPLDREISTCLDTLLQTQRVTSHHLTQLQIAVATERLGGNLLVIQPDVSWIRMFAFEHTQAAIQAGKDSVHAHLDDIWALVSPERN
ncbi:patatin-like phospholipase family protein [Candidatus Bipolaricaulota bacterium]|nr:patatin-like phospholipase family protein [Candidatus Bipolaricaulota bacterium]